MTPNWQHTGVDGYHLCAFKYWCNFRIIRPYLLCLFILYPESKGYLKTSQQFQMQEIAICNPPDHPVSGVRLHHRSHLVMQRPTAVGNATKSGLGRCCTPSIGDTLNGDGFWGRGPHSIAKLTHIFWWPRDFERYTYMYTVYIYIYIYLKIWYIDKRTYNWGQKNLQR